MFLTQKSFKKDLQSLKKNYNELEEAKYHIVDYIDSFNKNNPIGIPLLSISLDDISNVIDVCNIGKNEANFKSVIKQCYVYNFSFHSMNFIDGGNNSEARMKQRNSLLDSIDIDQIFKAHHSSAKIDTLYEKYGKDNLYGPIFFKMMLKFYHDMIMYLYWRYKANLYQKFNIDPSEYDILMYKSYNTLSSDIYSSSVPNICMPYIVLRPGQSYTIAYADDDPSIKFPSMDSLRNTCMIFPFSREIFINNPDPKSQHFSDSDKLKNIIVKYDKNFDIVQSNHSSISSIDDANYAIFAKAYIRGRLRIGNLFNNLYVSIVPKKDKSQSSFLIEYNRYGRSKRQINTVLNLWEVLRHNKLNWENTVEPEELDKIKEYKHSRSKYMQEYYYSSIVPTMRELSTKWTEFANKSMTKHLNRYEIPCCHISVLMRNNPLRRVNLSTDLYVIFNLYPIECYSCIDMKDPSVMSRFRRIACFIFDKKKTFKEIYESGDIKMHNIVMDKGYVCSTEDFMQISRFMNLCTVAMDHYKNVVLPALFKDYLENIDIIFNKKDENYVGFLKAYKEERELYKQYVKEPIYENNNCMDLSKVDSAHMDFEKFFTQVSYYNQNIVMKTTKLDFDDYSHITA